MVKKSIFIYFLFCSCVGYTFAAQPSLSPTILTPESHLVNAHIVEKANIFFKGLDKPNSFLGMFLDNFDKLDANKDSKISKFENIFKIKFTLGLNKMFSSINKNGDSYLTKEEIILSQKDEANLFKTNFYTKWLELDVDGNGFLSLLEAEKSKTLKNNFTIIDLNSDEKLSKNELIAYYNLEIVKIF